MASQSAQVNLGIDEAMTPATLKAAAAELIATAIFCFIGVGAVAVATAGGSIVGISLTHGFAFGLLVASIGPISGGHINPAVTFAMVVTGRMSVVKGAIYIVAQLLGACLGVALLRAFILDDVLKAIPGAGGHALNDAVVTEPIYGLGLEAIGTFILVWTIFAVAVHPRYGSGPIGPLFIGLAVAIIHFALFPLTGTGINPARSFGPALILPGADPDLPGRWTDHWIYWIGPLLGAAIAGLLYYVLYLKDEEA